MNEDLKSLHDLLWLLPTGVASVGVFFLQRLASSVAKLNEHMAVMVTRTDANEEKLADHETRIRKVEQA